MASVSVLSAPARFLFLLALVLNLASLFWFVSWWFDPVRLKYYTVQPVLYWALTTIGATGVLMYFFFWFLLWNMRRPVPIPAPEGLKVAIVTTRVASEAVEAIEGTLEKMSGVDYPHDSYLLDEEDNEEARAACEKWGVRHFSRKGNVMYNQSSGKFQAKTKGGNLNSWLYEFGKQYEFVTFLDPDHAPHARIFWTRCWDISRTRTSPSCKDRRYSGTVPPTGLRAAPRSKATFFMDPSRWACSASVPVLSMEAIPRSG